MKNNRFRKGQILAIEDKGTPGKRYIGFYVNGSESVITIESVMDTDTGKLIHEGGEWMYLSLNEPKHRIGEATSYERKKYHNLIFKEAKRGSEWARRAIGYVVGSAGDMGDISDGYHTFNELYRFRLLYNAALFNEWSASGKFDVVKSKRHSDGKECFGGGWFIVSAQLPTGQISNHYEIRDWGLFRCPEVDKAPEWDGHTPEDVMDRLENMILEGGQVKRYDYGIEAHQRILYEYVMKGITLKPGERMEIENHKETTSKKGLIANDVWNILTHRFGIETDIIEETEDAEGDGPVAENGRTVKRVYIVRRQEGCNDNKE